MAEPARRLLTVIIPAYEEQATIAALLSRVIAVDTESVGFDKEVIVCDDGSTDATGRITERLAEQDDRIHLVRLEQNSGKGAAIRAALEHARGDYCVIQDADLEYSPSNYLPMLTAAASGASAVYGSRFSNCAWPSGMKIQNLVGNRLLTGASNLLYRCKISDEATCLKLIRTDVLRALDLRSNGFDFCPEVTAKLALAGVPIEEVPIRYRGRPKAAGKKVRWFHFFQALGVLVRLRASGPHGLPGACSTVPAARGCIEQ